MLSNVSFPKGKHTKKIRLASLRLESQRSGVKHIEFGERWGGEVGGTPKELRKQNKTTLMFLR